jgi:NitT/TauT family transport system permease protein
MSRPNQINGRMTTINTSQPANTMPMKLNPTDSADHRRSHDSRLRSSLLGYAWSFVLSAGAIVVFLVLWELAPELGLIDTRYVPIPSAILGEMITLVQSGVLTDNTFISMSRVLAGLFLAIIIALALGFLLGWFKVWWTVFIPLLFLFSFVNPFSLFPAAIDVMGLGELPKVILILWASIWPILFGTVSGIRNVDPDLIKMGRSVGMSRAQIFTEVQIPGALPSIFAGIRLGALLAFIMLIGVEMIGASSGLGYMILYSCPFHGNYNVLEEWAGIVTVILLGFLLNWVIIMIERFFTGWKERIW